MSFFRPLWAILVSVSVLGGCYTFSGSGLPSGLKTVEIEQVIDEVRQSELADEATRLLMEEYLRNGALRPVDADGQSLLKTRLTQYSHVPQQADASGNVSRFRVTVGFDAKFVDLRDETVLFEGNGVSGTWDYDPATETESDARTKAVKAAVRKLVDNTVSGW
ncbi:MAG: hypothetical protein H6686_05110 [Fibrobacteria bacterium]|nr:hypothetical protein [Fibrobacteria bacterium]